MGTIPPDGIADDLRKKTGQPLTNLSYSVLSSAYDAKTGEPVNCPAIYIKYNERPMDGVVISLTNDQLEDVDFDIWEFILPKIVDDIKSYAVEKQRQERSKYIPAKKE